MSEVVTTAGNPEPKITAAADFTSFGAFLAAVVGSEMLDVDQATDQRLHFHADASGLNEVGGSAGGYLVPTSFAATLWTRTYATGRLLARCDRQPVTRGNRLVIPAISEIGRGAGEQPAGSRFGGAQAYWTDEAGANNDSRLQFDLLTLELKKLLGMFYASDELLQDAPALAAALTRLFGLEASFAIENAIVNGDGIAKPLGILKSPSLIVVPKDNGQAAGTITRTNLAAMAKTLWGPSHATAVWLMGNDAYGKILDAEEESGVAMFETGPDGERMLLQMPVEINEYTPALGSDGDVVLADFSQYIIAEAEQSPNVISSIHVKFVTDESAFKMRYRVDGQPAWKTSITPNNSANKQSPFVALGAR